MVKRDTLIKFIQETIGSDLLAKARQKDELANGVQFLGGEDVKKVTLGVSLNVDWLASAAESDSNFCIFHHGFDPRTYKSAYSPSAQKRLELIFKHNLTIMGFHYALDAHRELGNNAVILRELGATIKEPLFEEWGFVGEFEKPVMAEELAERCSSLFEHDVLAIYAGPPKIKRVGVVSGAGTPQASHLQEFLEKKIDLYLSGETSESYPHKMKECGINYFVCGHYATEVFGVQELGKQIKRKFKDKIEVEFIDIPNPI